MSGKDYWFRTGKTFTIHGWREAGLVTSGWKGWLFTAVIFALGFAAWRLAVFASAHHWTQIAFASWGAIAVLGLSYLIVGSLKSK